MRKKGLIGLLLTACLLTACGSSASSSAQNEDSLVYGTTGYGASMSDTGLNPHENYSGWSCVRYGVGETLFKFSDEMEPQPWLATGYKFTDDTHCVITLRDDVYFSSGRKMDGDAVVECLEDLIKVNDRAPEDLKISNLTADGQTVTIETSEPTPALINYLCDPYGAIIDMEAGVTDDGNVSGTGPFIASKVTDTEIDLDRNENYWDGDVKLAHVTVKGISDGQTLTNALQTGEVDAVYGLPYASYSIFDNDAYETTSCSTSRQFFGKMNFRSEIMQDENIRKAICEGIDKENFVKVLLDGHGEVSVGPFPSNLSFGDETVSGPSYDPDDAKSLLEQSGWTDTDGDGYVDKDGEKLTVRWLTYPGRQELPLLAEAAQSSLKEIGIDVEVNSTDNHQKLWEDGDYDIYVSAMVTAPTGDPEYFFTTHMLDDSAKNYEGYHSDELESLESQLHTESDADKRSELGTQMSQVILDDSACVFVSHLQMGIVTRAGVKNLVPHPCDYYELTADTELENS